MDGDTENVIDGRNLKIILGYKRMEKYVIDFHHFRLAISHFRVPICQNKHKLFLIILMFPLRKKTKTIHDFHFSMKHLPWCFPEICLSKC